MPIKDNSHTAVILLPENELMTWFATVDHLLSLDELKRNVVLGRISQNRDVERNSDDSSSHGLSGFLKEVFTFPDDYKQAVLAQESNDCDKTCAMTHREEFKQEMIEQSFNIVLGVFSPATKLKLFGSQSLVEGRFLGDGKDAFVYALKGDSDWVIKVLKFGGAERAEMLTHYINQLASDPRLKVPPVTDLHDGRLLQRFVEGSPTANELWGGHVETAAHLAKELTSIARKTLGIKDGELFVNDSKFKIGVDPSFANFYFDKKGLYQGWIDPIFHFGEEVHK